MPAGLDIVLVVLAVVLSTAYLIRRKLRLAKGTQRDWTTGHSESCNDCGLVKIRKEQLKVLHKQA